MFQLFVANNCFAVDTNQEKAIQWLRSGAQPKLTSDQTAIANASVTYTVLLKGHGLLTVSSVISKYPQPQVKVIDDKQPAILLPKGNAKLTFVVKKEAKVEFAYGVDLDFKLQGKSQGAISFGKAHVVAEEGGELCFFWFQGYEHSKSEFKTTEEIVCTAANAPTLFKAYNCYKVVARQKALVYAMGCHSAIAFDDSRMFAHSCRDVKGLNNSQVCCVKATRVFALHRSVVVTDGLELERKDYGQNLIRHN